MNIGEVLRGLAQVAHIAGRLVPGAKDYSGPISAALGLAGDIAASGKDPVAEIKRIRNSDAELAHMHASWRATWRARR